MNTIQNPPTLIGLGTAAIGRPHYINIRQETPEPFDLNAFRQKGWDVLDNAYLHGIRYFDTAPGYGMAEQLLIDWVTQKKDYSIEIATKWGYTYTANFDPKAIRHEVKEHSLEKLNEQWQQSQLLIPHLSTYQIHSATFDTGILDNEPVLNRLAELSAEHGLIIGLTASGTRQPDIVKKALEVEINGRPLFNAFQVTYNILDQGISELADELKMANKRIIIKEALANGRLFPNDRYPGYQPLYRSLHRMAEKYKVGIDAIALRFCMDSIQPFVVLSGAANEHHITENLKANKFQLENDELEELRFFKIKTNDYWTERKNLGWN